LTTATASRLCMATSASRTPNSSSGGQIGLDEREFGESFEGSPGTSGAALLDLDGPDCPLDFVAGEDVQVGAGDEPQDQVLEAEEAAGEAAGVLRGGGAAVEAGFESGGGQCPVAGDQVTEDGGAQGGLASCAGGTKCSPAGGYQAPSLPYGDSLTLIRRTAGAGGDPRETDDSNADTAPEGLAHHELQIVLTLILGACTLCCQPFNTGRSRRSPRQNLTKYY
jgi:hypothetical protein